MAPSPKHIFPGEVRKILAIKIRQLGDTVLMTAALKRLHQAFPKAEIHVVVSHVWAPILHHTPGVAKIWPYTRHSDTASRVKALASLGLKLREQRYDLVINFHASPSSSLLAFSTGAKVRSIHFHGHEDKNRFSTVEIPNKGKLLPIIERDMDAVRALGIEIPPGELPEIFLQSKEILRGAQLLGARPASWLMVGLGSSRPTKCWPVENFAEVAKKWCEQFDDGKILALGSSEELPLLVNFRSAVLMIAPELSDRVAIQAGLRVRELAAVLSHARVYLGNDSGPRHIAVSVGTPTVTLFGPEHPFEWHPYPRDRHPYFFQEGLPCRKDAHLGMPEWCALETCEIEQHRCMRGISPDSVLQEVLRVAKIKS